MARQSPFALTNPLHNFGHAISFITAQQMLRCFELWQPVAGTELLAWQLVAGHEMGHHHAERLKAKIAALSVANNGNKATGTGTIHATNQGAFAESQTDTSLATEAFCDSFGIMRLLRDKPASAARAAIQWQADFRRLGTFASVVAAAESYPQKKRGRAGFYFDVRYYTFGASDHALQNLKIWRAAARATKTEDQLAQATTAMLEPILPVIEMQARRFQTFALFRLNRPADRQQLATLIPNLTPATMLDRTVSPQTLLTESLHAG